MKTSSILMLRFLMQATFSASVLFFCIFMLAMEKADSDRDKALYWSGLNATLAYWLPSPNLPTEEEDKKKRG